MRITTGPGADERLEDRLLDWADHQLLTSEQAEAIRGYERQRRHVLRVPGVSAARGVPSQVPAAIPEAGSPEAGIPMPETGAPQPPAGGPATATAAAATPPAHRTPVAAQVVAYLGAILAIVAAVLAIRPIWGDIGLAGQVSLLAVVAAFLLVVGEWLFHVRQTTTDRLGGLVWLGALAAVAGLTAVVAHDGFSLSTLRTTLVIGIVTVGAALVLWLLQRNAFQLTGLVVASVAAVNGIVAQWEPDTPTPFGLAIAALGLLWLGLAWFEVTQPTVIARIAGAWLLVNGLLFWGIDMPFAGRLAATLASAALLALGVAQQRTELLVIGAYGLLIALPLFVTWVAGDAIGVPLGLLVAAAGLLIVALRVLRRRQER